MTMKLPQLKIGDLTIDVPIIQGGMGVAVSKASLASAVSSEGGLGVIASVGLGEELLFRGLVQRDMTSLFGWKWGLLGASLMFGIMHLTWRSVPELGYTAFVGFVLGYVYYRTGSLTAPIIAHGVGNTVLVGIMPYIII